MCARISRPEIIHEVVGGKVREADESEIAQQFTAGDTAHQWGESVKRTGENERRMLEVSVVRVANFLSNYMNRSHR